MVQAAGRRGGAVVHGDEVGGTQLGAAPGQGVLVGCGLAHGSLLRVGSLSAEWWGERATPVATLHHPGSWATPSTRWAAGTPVATASK
ncbi:hypothetical protein GCM10027600_12760 [Nocardioides ginsengisegetis]